MVNFTSRRRRRPLLEDQELKEKFRTILASVAETLGCGTHAGPWEAPRSAKNHDGQPAISQAKSHSDEGAFKIVEKTRRVFDDPACFPGFHRPERHFGLL